MIFVELPTVQHSCLHTGCVTARPLTPALQGEQSATGFARGNGHHQLQLQPFTAADRDTRQVQPRQT